jgi:hypothetical protein
VVESVVMVSTTLTGVAQPITQKSSTKNNFFIFAYFKPNRACSNFLMTLWLASILLACFRPFLRDFMGLGLGDAFAIFFQKF